MRRASLPAGLLVLLSLLSCQKAPTSPVPPSVVADAKSAFAIMGDLPLWTLSKGALSLKENVLIGEKLLLLGPTARVAQAGKERDFLQVRRESGPEGWVRADYVVSNAILGVVTDDEAVLYSAPRNSAATTASITAATIVAIDADTGGMSFIRITCFDAAAKMLLRDVYLRNEGISSRVADIESAILLQLAAGSRNRKQQQAFLSSALKDHPDSVFRPKVETALAALTAPVAPVPAQRATEPATGTMTALADAVSVLDVPNEKTGKALATLQKNQSVEIQEKTTDSFTIGGASAPWYRIKDPPGWVFGGSLQEAQ